MTNPRSPSLFASCTVALCCSLFACDGGDPGPDPTPETPHDCIEVPAGEDPFGDLEAAPAPDVPLVIGISFNSADPGHAWVEFLPDDEDETMATPRDTEAVTHHENLLLGLHASTPVAARAFVEIDETLWCSEPLALETGPLDPALPELILAESDPDRSTGGYSLLPLITQDATWPVIIDDQGQYVWFVRSDLSTFRVQRSLDHRGVLLLQPSGGTELPGRVQRMGYTGVPMDAVDLTGAHIDFTEVEPGLYASLGWEERTYDDGGEQRILVGDTIVEGSAEGGQRIVWRAFDHLEPDLSETYLEETPANPDAEDWFHGNHIHYNPADNSYIVTSGTLDLAVKVRRSDGSVEWILGKDGEYSSPSGDELVAWPHSAQELDDGSVLLFNRGRLDDDCSAIARIRLDHDAAEAWMEWEFVSDECFQVYFLGEAVALEGGNVLAVWSTAGQIDEITPDGEVVWSLQSALGAGMGFVQRIGGLYD